MSKALKSKLIFTAIVAVYVSLRWLFQVPCPFIEYLNIPCPGCGMTRAYVSLLQGDFAAAFSYHAMFWAMPIVYLYFWFDGKLFKNPLLNRMVIIAIGIGVLAVWIVKLILHFL